MRWRVSAWTHPASGNFECFQHSVPIISGTFADPEEPRGRMSFIVAASPVDTDEGRFSWQDLINLDPNLPANNRNALIRLYRDGIDNTGDPDMEFYLDRFQRRILDDGTEVVQLSGTDWRLAGLNPAVARWWDYENGATETHQPNWEYGGRNILRDDGFETTGEIPAVYELRVDATAGTYDITDGTDIATIPFDSGASGIENSIEANIASITDINVTGTGTEDDPFVLEFNEPTFGVTLNVNGAALTGTVEINRTQEGGFDTGNWTLSQTVSDGTPRIYGAVASTDGFVVTTDQAHTGTKSLRINPLDVTVHGRYTGGQVVLSGLEPGIYQASIWARTGSATDKFRFVLRTVWGDTLERADGLLATDTGGLGGTSMAADTWTEFTIPDVIIPVGVSEIIFRFANVNATGNPFPFYLDDPYFARGLTASTIGTISSHLIADAQVDHAPPAVIPWIQEGAYTTTLDSAGDPWIRDESITIHRGKRYGDEIYGGQFLDLGYTYDLLPNGATAAWDLEIWNPGGAGTTHTDIAFLLAYGIDGGVIAGRVPKQTRILAEGADGLIAEVSDATQEANFGVWQEFLGEPDITDSISLAARASEYLNQDLLNAIALTVELAPDAPIPYQDFNRGDTAPFVAGGYFARHDRRITEITLTADTNAGGEVEWTPSVTASKLLTGERARNEAIYRLLTAFQRMPEKGTQPRTTPRLGGAGGAPVWVIAASDSTPREKEMAHIVCDGRNDREIIQAVLDLDGLGRILLLSGTFRLTSRSAIQAGLSGIFGVIQGIGKNVTFLDFDLTAGGEAAFAISGGTLKDFTVDVTAGGGVTAAQNYGTTISDININASTYGIKSAVNRLRIANVFVGATGTGIEISGGGSRAIIDGVYIESFGGSGITAPDGADRIQISDAHIDAANHGIHLTGDENHIRGVEIIDPGNAATNTYDAILLSGSRNTVDAVKILPNAVTKPRYGVHISGGTGTRIGSVDFGALANYGTHPINDVPTDTRWATAQTAVFKVAGALSTGTSFDGRWPVQAPGILLDTHVTVDTAPSGGPVTVDINLNAASVYATATKPGVPDGANVGTRAKCDPTVLAENDLLTMDLDAVNAAEDATVVTRIIPA